MEIGSTSSQVLREPISPESLIESALGEVFRVYPKATIRIDYDLNHYHLVSVDSQKVGRALANIVGNAIQALKGKGKIWFKTREQGAYVEFCIGNAGTFIPTENLKKLFDAFFTSGKRGGTGLGLAIAQKMVIAHGGKIWCESSKTDQFPDGKVEFLFTMPIDENKLARTTARLPSHSSEITKALLSLNNNEEGSVSDKLSNVDKRELTLEAEIIEASQILERPLSVLVADDEAIYRTSLTAFLSRTPELSDALSVKEADGSRKVLDLLRSNCFDLIITDVDMGRNSLDGFELVKELRSHQNIESLICVHSNRIVASDHKSAIENGADSFLPKPMARAQLLRLILQAAERNATRYAQGVYRSREYRGPNCSKST